MTVEYRYDQELNILRTQIVGVIDPSEVEDYFRQITRSDSFHPDTPALIDFRKADFSHASRALGEQLVAIRNRFPQRANAKLAMLVDDELAFGMNRMYQILSDDLNSARMRLFRDETLAVEWLTD